MLERSPLSPLEKLRALYARLWPERELEADIGIFIERAYFVATPDYILMGKAADINAAEELITDPAYVFDPQRWSLNCWYVWAYVGDRNHLLSGMPYKMSFIAFHRRGRIHFYDSTRFCQCSAHKTRFSVPS